MSFGLAVAAGIQLASAVSGRDSAISGARRAADAKIGYLDSAQGIISKGYSEARDTTKQYSDKAQTYQDPYVKTGENANSYFGNLSTDVLNDKLNRYLSNADPLMKYADKITSQALNKKLAALGRTDSGNAIEQDLDRTTKLAYEFSNLANTRLQQEIAVQQNLLNVGQTAANTSTQLQYNTGNTLSNLFTNEAQLNAAYEAEKGGAASDMEAIIGNANTNFWGNIGGMAGTIGGLTNLFNSNTNTTTTTDTTTTTPATTPTNSTNGTPKTTPVINKTPTVPNLSNQSSVNTQTNPTLQLSYLPSTGNISTVYYNNNPIGVPPRSSQNYYTYNPYQQTYGGY